LALPLAAQPDGNSQGIFPYQAHTTTLDNGLQVIMVPMDSGGLAAYWSIVRTGARDEVEPGRTGFAHFFEHMMFRGTEKYPSDAYDKMVTGIGADANAFTSNDVTAYFLNIASEDLEQVMEIESDRFRNLAYPKDLFRTEAGAVYGEYRKNRTNPFFTVMEASLKVAFTQHTYNHTAMGFEEDIRKMPDLFDYSKTFFTRYYRPENTILLITGDFETTPTLALVRKYYAGWERGYVAPPVQPEPLQENERRIDVAYPGRTLPIVWISYKAPAFDPSNATSVAARLLCDLAFGETSAIYKKLVLEQRSVESIEASLRPSRDPGLLNIGSRVKDPAHIDAVIAEIDRVVAEVKESPPDARRLEDIKSRIKYDFLMDLDTPANVAIALHRFLAITGDLGSVDEFYNAVDQVTPEGVQKAAQDLLVANRRTVAILRGEG
jgi:zinc protease